LCTFNSLLGFTTHYLIWDYHPLSIGDYTPFYPYLGFYEPATLFGCVHHYLLLVLRILRLPFGYTYLQFAAWVYYPLLIWDWHLPLIWVYAPDILNWFYASIIFIWTYAPLFLFGLQTLYFLFGFTHLLFQFYGLRIRHLDSGSTYPQLVVWALPPSIYLGLPLAVYVSTIFIFGLMHSLSSIWVRAPTILYLDFLRTLLSLVLRLRTLHLSLGFMHSQFAFRFTHPQFYSIPLTTRYLAGITAYLLLGYTIVILYLDLCTPDDRDYVLLSLLSSHISVFRFEFTYPYFVFAHPLLLSSFAHPLPLTHFHAPMIHGNRHQLLLLSWFTHP
jgi:hypothetical protein